MNDNVAVPRKAGVFPSREIRVPPGSNPARPLLVQAVYRAVPGTGFFQRGIRGCARGAARGAAGRGRIEGSGGPAKFCSSRARYARVSWARVPEEGIGAINDAGAVNVLYGTGGGGLSAVGNQFWYQGATASTGSEGGIASAALPGTHALGAPMPNPSDGRATFTLEVAEAQAVRRTIMLRAGQDYRIVGVCDDRCTDLDLRLSDPRGQVIAQDAFADGVWTFHVQPAFTGDHVIEVAMVRCSGSPCWYAFNVYSR